MNPGVRHCGQLPFCFQFTVYRLLLHLHLKSMNGGFPGGSVAKNLPANADVGLDPGSGRSPEGGNGNPLQYSCLRNPHGQRSLMGYSPWGCTELDMTEHTHTCTGCAGMFDSAVLLTRFVLVLENTRILKVCLTCIGFIVVLSELIGKYFWNIFWSLYLIQ